MKRVSVLKCLLIFLLLLSLSACVPKNDENLEKAEAKVQQMLEYQKAGSVEDTYALIYPGIADSETYSDLFQRICEYCPLEDGFTIERTGYDVYNRVGSTPKSIVALSYTLMNNGTEYLISATYQADEAGEGFTNFQIISRAEYNALSAQSGTASK